MTSTLKHPIFNLFLTILMGTLMGALVSPASFADTVITVESKQFTNWFALEAKIEAVNESTVSAQTSGRIQSIAVDVNDYVKQGELIIQLRDKQQRLSVDQAQAGLTQANAGAGDAKSKLDQSLPLYQQGAVSKAQFDTIKANSQAAAAAVIASQAVLSQAKEQLSYTEIRAPYSGIVKSRLVEVGESVNPGTPLMVGLSLANLRAVANIPQRLAPYIADKNNFQILNQANVIPAKNVVVFPYADPSSHSFKVRVDIDAEGQQLFPGMWVKLNIPIGNKMSLRIPKTALIQQSELSSVYVKTESGFALRQVRIGDFFVDDVEILAGLKDGESIALNGYSIMSKQ
jgi:RND family efflux transporter MFP subunit